MKVIEFDYRQERLRTGKAVVRPVAKVYLLRSGSEWIAEYFYIDSGADYTLIPYRMGRFFEITFQQRARKVVFVWHGEKDHVENNAL